MSMLLRTCNPHCTARRSVARLASAVQGRRMAGSMARPAVPEVYQETADPVVVAFQEHQKTAARPAPADQARTWVSLARCGVMATVDSNQFPNTQLVEFITDASGKPVFAASTMSPHTADLQSNGRVSLIVTAPNWSGLQDGRVSLQGTVRPVKDDEKAAFREAFLKKYPNAFWVDFGDFKWFILDSLNNVRFNAGFGAAAKVTPQQYEEAKADPVAAFAGPVCGHMNADHQQDMLDMVAHYTGLTDAESVKLTELDRLGLNAEITRKGSTFKARLPFVRPAEDRKSVKDVIVEMTRAARAAVAGKARVAGASEESTH